MFAGGAMTGLCVFERKAMHSSKLGLTGLLLSFLHRPIFIRQKPDQ